MSRNPLRLSAGALSLLLTMLFSCTTADKAQQPAGTADTPVENSGTGGSAREAAGQMIICGFNGTTLPPEFRQFIFDYKIGNIILFAKNIHSVPQTRALCADIQQTVLAATGHNAFICVDQEGGRITRLPKEMVSLAGASSLAAAHRPETVYKAGLLTAKQLRLCGINVDFAPVADINSNPQNPVIGDRSYGTTAQEVSVYARQMAKGLRDGGILGCAKHFPGHGDTDVDSHLNLPVVNKNYADLKDFELTPFKSLIHDGIPLIMTAHIMFPQIDKTYPATLSSKFLTDILRKELQFSGIIVTDDLEMNAIRKHFGIVDGAVTAVQAGADMVCLSVYSDGAAQISDAFVNRISRERLTLSADRIIAAKNTPAAVPDRQNLSAAQVQALIKKYNAQMSATCVAAP